MAYRIPLKQCSKLMKDKNKFVHSMEQSDKGQKEFMNHNLKFKKIIVMKLDK